MITCQNCKHQDLDGAMFCSQCGTQFLDTVDTTVIQPARIVNSSGISGNTAPKFPQPPSEFSLSTVALLLIDTGEITYIPNDKNITIGRSTEGQLVVPDIDLAPYNAYEAGVSRLHTSIALKRNQVLLKDLGSANGTRVNGQKISAHTEYDLAHGDIITLGKLKFQILVQKSAE